MTNPARNIRDEHHVIWLEPRGASDRCWCSDNQWDDEGIKYVLADTVVGHDLKWECKDFADGWIRFPSLSEALKYQQATGCVMRPLVT